MAPSAITCVLHASQIRADWSDVLYTFHLDPQLQLLACGKVVALSQGLTAMYSHFPSVVAGKLFELNSVCIEDETHAPIALRRLLHAFAQVGVTVLEHAGSRGSPHAYQAVGRLSHPIRFYYDLERQKLVFLSSAVQLRLVESG